MTRRNSMPVVKNSAEAMQQVAFRWMSILLFGVVFGAWPVAKAATWGDFTYETNGATTTITGYTGPGGAVTIPDTVANMPMTNIGYSAFDGCTNLTGVYFRGNAPTSVGVFVFSGASKANLCIIGLARWAGARPLPVAQRCFGIRWFPTSACWPTDSVSGSPGQGTSRSWWKPRLIWLAAPGFGCKPPASPTAFLISLIRAGRTTRPVSTGSARRSEPLLCSSDRTSCHAARRYHKR